MRPVGLRLAALLLPGALWAVAGACGGPPAPRWLDLAALATEGAPPVGELAPGLRVVQAEGCAWLVSTLPAEAWSAQGGGRSSAEQAIYAVGHPPDGGSPYRLLVDGTEIAYEPDPERFGTTPERFTTSTRRSLRVELLRAADAPAPQAAELWACLAPEGRAEGGLRVRGRRLSGAGFFVPSGAPRTLALALPPDARLSFGIALEPLLGRREERTAARVFRVRLDGALLFEQRVEPGVLGEALSWHAVELPRGGVARAKLAFEVEGPLALSSFLAPVVGPRATGTYGARPHDARPDLVVFLADTFRADNLAAYGSTLALTPEIDRFAGAARVYAHAWSVSTHTLPAHSSMFSGVYPHQNGQVDYHNPLPEPVETLAERLSAAGYRCGLISDGVMVSAAHGLDQGFALCDERHEAGTLERVRAFLAADDGRPVFLFVQTYAAHTPYQASDETRARLGTKLRLDKGFAELEDDPLLRVPLPPDWEGLLPLGHEGPPTEPAAVELAQRLHDLYRAGVADLDATFGRVRAELEARGLLARGYLLFTSDHGESFFEHGRPFHTNWVYETELHVPLLLAGPGVAPGREARPVSLIDLAPTLAALAGLEPRAHWRGRSLLDPPAERVLYAFQSRRTVPGSTLAVLDGTRKIIGYEDPEAVRAGKLHAAFDLAADPGEARSVHGEAEWAAELARRHAAELEELLTPLVESAHAQRTPEQLEALRGLGYTGAEDEERDEPPGSE